MFDPVRRARIDVERIHRVVRRARGSSVVLDSDLAALYDVDVKVLNQAVKRNRSRFPDDFMFQLDDREAADLRSQSVIANNGRGGRRTAPYVFTEQGVAMLSSVLRSDPARRGPLPVRRLLRRCLDKDPRRRLSAIADARLDLDEDDGGDRRR